MRGITIEQAPIYGDDEAEVEEGIARLGMYANGVDTAGLALGTHDDLPVTTDEQVLSRRNNEPIRYAGQTILGHTRAEYPADSRVFGSAEYF